MDREELQRQNVVRIFQIANALQTHIDRILKKHKLTTKQFFMMIIMGSFPYDPRIGEIGERFATSRQNVKQVLNKLEQVGFVDLYKDESDSRIIRARMTEKAQEFWMSREQEDENTMNNIFSVLTNQEMQVMMEGFMKLGAKMEEINKK